MSNRTIKHSPRYSGPMGDSRPPAEIFAGIEARQRENESMCEQLVAALDHALQSRKLASHQGRLDTIREIFIGWLADNDLDFREKVASVEQGGRRPHHEQR